MNYAILALYFGFNLGIAVYMAYFSVEDGILDDVHPAPLFVLNIFLGIFVVFYVLIDRFIKGMGGNKSEKRYIDGKEFED